MVAVRWGNSDWDAATGSSSHDTSGALVGGTIGYNYQVGQAVFGIEGDIDWTNIRGSSSAVPCTTSCETSNSWLGTVRGRIGYAFDRFMPYITGGVAFGDIKANPAASPAAATQTSVGRLAVDWKRQLPVRGLRRSNIFTSTLVT